MNLLRLDRTLLIAAVALYGASVGIETSAQGPAPTVLDLPFPSGGAPWQALSPRFTSCGPPAVENPSFVPYGFPNCDTGHPCGSSTCFISLISLHTGYIDDDDELDFLVVMSQRLILAFSVPRDSDGVPNGPPEALWAWFDPAATMYKAGYSRDRAMIADLDGDGDHEVVVIVEGQKTDPAGYDSVTSHPYVDPNNRSSSRRLMIFDAWDDVGDPPPAQQPTDPQFDNVILPKILAWRWLNDTSCDAGMSNVLTAAEITAIEVTGSDADGVEILLADQSKGQTKVFKWKNDGLGIQEVYCENFQTLGSNFSPVHKMHAFDLNADGYDEILNAGVVEVREFLDLVQACGPNPTPQCIEDARDQASWFFHGWPASNPMDNPPVPQYVNCVVNTNNGIDDLLPLDLDEDGLFETLYGAHDCEDLLVTIDPNDLSAAPLAARVNDGPTLICENSNGPYMHGQSLTPGRFFDGPDPNGYDDLHVLVTPKDYGGIKDGSALVNARAIGSAEFGDEITYNSNSSVIDGPHFERPLVLDWDGDRSTDEAYSHVGQRDNYVFELVPEDYDTQCIPAPTTKYPHRWDTIAFYNKPTLQDHLVVDAFGDYRDEVVIVGSDGIVFLSNPDPVANKHKHLGPLTVDANGEPLDRDYWRRMQGHGWRYLEYDGLMTLDELEIVTPFTAAGEPNDTFTYQAIGHYSNRAGVTHDVDLSDEVDWILGDPTVGSFVDNVLTLSGEGLSAVRAVLRGDTTADDIVSLTPALAYCSTSPEPHVLYAGWTDDYVVAGVPSHLRIEARVVSPVDPVDSVAMSDMEPGSYFLLLTTRVSPGTVWLATVCTAGRESGRRSSRIVRRPATVTATCGSRSRTRPVARGSGPSCGSATSPSPLRLPATQRATRPGGT